MKGFEDFFTEAWWDKDPVFVEDNVVGGGQVVSKLVVFSELHRQVLTAFGYARFNQVKEIIHCLITGCGFLDPLPGDGLEVEVVE